MRIIWIIAKNTFLEIIRDRILYGLVVFAILMIGLSLILGQLTFDEQVRISANLGFAATHLSAVIISLFAGGSLVAKEIDKKTIMTLLARPISRLQFLLGKSLGLLLVVGTVMTGLALILTGILSFIGFTLNIGFLLGFVGIALESVVLLAFAILFSTFARPMMVACFGIGVFLIGHWLNTLQGFAEKSESPAFKAFGEAASTVLPNLEIFNWRSLAIYGETISIVVFLKAVLLAFLWFALLTSASVLVFRKRDFG